MDETAKPPPEMRFKLNLGLMIMGAGCLIMTFVDRIWFVGFILVGAGAVIAFPTLRQWRRVMPSVSTNQKKKRFVFLLAVLTFTWASCPFILHWHDPNQNFRVLVTISAVCWPLSVAYSYWYVFKKLK